MQQLLGKIAGKPQEEISIVGPMFTRLQAVCGPGWGQCVCNRVVARMTSVRRVAAQAANGCLAGCG